MCGRYVIATPPDAIRRLFEADGVGLNFLPHYNAAPGQDLPVIRLHPETGHRVLGLLRWGLLVQGPQDCVAVHQRPWRDRQNHIGVSKRLSIAPLPRASGRVL